jgi:hypothetical protein
LGLLPLASYPCAGPPLNLPAWKKAWTNMAFFVKNDKYKYFQLNIIGSDDGLINLDLCELDTIIALTPMEAYRLKKLLNQELEYVINDITSGESDVQD